MRLATVDVLGCHTMAAVVDDDLIDLRRAHVAMLAAEAGRNPQTLDEWDDLRRRSSLVLPVDTRSVLSLGRDALEETRRAVDFAGSAGIDRPGMRGVHLSAEQVEFLPPIMDPGKILCIGRNYADHVAEASRPHPEVPIVFVRFASSLTGHRQPIVRPRVSHQLDWEGELAVVIGQACRHVSRDDAMRVVAGYSNFNEASVRDYQNRSVQWTAGKNFPSTGAFGPYLVTSDEASDPSDMELSVHVNGERMQHANTASLIFDVPELIAHITEWQPLLPGDVIVTGTPGGVGFVRNPPVFLKPGDKVSVEIGNLATLENHVVDEH